MAVLVDDNNIGIVDIVGTDSTNWSLGNCFVLHPDVAFENVVGLN